jgi:pyruvate/2-oxoglutarate dehydrogenase complex dihydrolipoamide acyltransferase (E2) component
MSRKLYLAALITEAVRVIKEAQGVVPPTGQAVPPSPVPPAPATNAPAPSPAPTPDGANTPPPVDGEQPKPFDLDTLIDRLNVIRGGKSFADPEVYGHLTTYFNSLNDADKASVDRFLQSIGRIVIQVDDTQQTGSGNAQPAMNQTPAPAPAPAAPAPAPGGAPAVQESIDLSEGNLLLESVKEGVRFKFAGKEMDFGSSDHLKVLKYMLHGLQNLRDCYQTGSANRLVYATTCHKLRRLIAKHGPTN